MFSLPKKAVHCAVIAAFCSFSTGCGQMQTQFKETFASDDPCANNARNIGIAVGVVGGAILGNVLGKNNRAAGTLIGAAAGGLIGGLIGYDIDRRRCELYKIAKANNVELQMRDLTLADGKGNEEIAGMSAQVVADEQFVSNSFNPTPQAAHVFTQFARRYLANAENAKDTQTQQQLAARQKQMRLLFIGHTDDTGNTQKNADLSEKRARAVAQIFAREGFNKNQIFYQGAGETLPIADNRTEEGRRQNRRVEIVDLSSDEAFAAYLQSRKPNTAYYRPKSSVQSVIKKASQKPRKVASQKVESAAVETESASESRILPQAAFFPRKKESEAAGIVSAKAAASTTKKAASMESAAISESTSRSGATGAAFIDFGGRDSLGDPAGVDIGKIEAPKSGGFFIKEVAAATSLVDNCAEDSYRSANGVKSLSDDQLAKLKTSDYLPGFYGTSWSGLVNGHLVAMTNVTLLRDGGAPATRPNLLVYKDYQPNKKAKANYRNSPKVNAYQGQKGVLYRVFVDEPGAPLQCIDLVLNKGVANPQSNLLYVKEGKLYQAPYTPKLAKR